MLEKKTKSMSCGLAFHSSGFINSKPTDRESKVFTPNGGCPLCVSGRFAVILSLCSIVGGSQSGRTRVWVFGEI